MAMLGRAASGQVGDGVPDRDVSNQAQISQLINALMRRSAATSGGADTGDGYDLSKLPKTTQIAAGNLDPESSRRLIGAIAKAKSMSTDPSRGPGNREANRIIAEQMGVGGRVPGLAPLRTLPGLRLPSGDGGASMGGGGGGVSGSLRGYSPDQSLLAAIERKKAEDRMRQQEALFNRAQDIRNNKSQQSVDMREQIFNLLRGFL